jgi:hypothetical protein
MLATQYIKNGKDKVYDYKLDSDESKIMNAMLDEYCEKWIGNRKKQLDVFKNETIELIANMHREYIAATIKNEVCGPNLHSQFVLVMDEFRLIKQQISMMRENEEISKKAMIVAHEELKEQVSAKKIVTKSVSPKKVSVFAPFISQKAKEFADENGINADDVEGTGKDAKIKIVDIRKVIKGSSGAVAKGKKTNASTAAAKKICCGVSKVGAPCGSSGSVTIRGSWYCKKHQSQGDNIIEKLEEAEYEDYDESKDKLVPESSFSSQFRELSMSSAKSMTKADLAVNAILDDDKEVEDDDKEVEDDDKEVEDDDKEVEDDDKEVEDDDKEVDIDEIDEVDDNDECLEDDIEEIEDRDD